MGLSESKNKELVILYNEIKYEMSDYIEKNTYWTDDKICNKIELFYYDKLLNFNNSDIIDLSIGIGIKINNQDEIDKSKLCAEIIDYYRDKIIFLNSIEHELNELFKKKHMAEYGPVCRNVMYDINLLDEKKQEILNDIETCTANGGSWYSKDMYINNIKDSREYNKWINQNNKLNTLFFNNLIKIKKSLDKFFKNKKITQEEFNFIRDNIYETIYDMNKICNRLVLSIINTPF
jgi:hypothetical protein